MQEPFSATTVEQAKTISQALSLFEKKPYSSSELFSLLSPLPYGRSLLRILKERKCISKIDKKYIFNNEPINYKLIAAELTLLKHSLKEYYKGRRKNSKMSESDMILHLKNLGYKIYKEITHFKEF